MRFEGGGDVVADFRPRVLITSLPLLGGCELSPYTRGTGSVPVGIFPHVCMKVSDLNYFSLF